MAWIYLAESADLPWRWRRGSDQSPIVKSIDTAKGYCFPGCPEATCPIPPSGTMCEPLHGHIFWGQSTSSTAASRARTSALQAMERAWAESVADYFLRSRDSLAKYDHASSSWKMCLPFGAEGPTLSADDWPSSGMTVAGECFPLSTWERRTSESDGGYWPTATATDSKSSRNATVKNRQVEGHSGVTLTDFVTLFPTPSATSYGTNKGGGSGRVGPARPGLEPMARHSLWPTPTTRDRVRSPEFRDGRTLSPSEETGGRLNPTWVEWLQAYPLGWTVCADWATPFVRPPRGKRSKD
jgi:hypothetical protein